MYALMSLRFPPGEILLKDTQSRAVFQLCVNYFCMFALMKNTATSLKCVVEVVKLGKEDAMAQCACTHSKD